jgi:hypothetical protein
MELRYVGITPQHGVTGDLDLNLYFLILWNHKMHSANGKSFLYLFYIKEGN